MSTSSPISRYHEIYHTQPAVSEEPPAYQPFIVIDPEVVVNGGESPAHHGSHSTIAVAQNQPTTHFFGIRSGGVGDLPSYDEAIDPDSAPPPSYDSLFGRVREAHKSSKGLMDFAKNILILLLGTLGCTIILGVTIVIPICMIVFGMIYMYDCPAGEYIPVYLLVGGGFGVLKQLMHLSTRVRSREDQEAERERQSPTQQLINFFMFGWFIIGSFWIFKEYEPNYDPSKGKYCNKSLYLFAFWLITSVYISLGVVTFALCAIAIGSILSSHQRHHSTNNHMSL